MEQMGTGTATQPIHNPSADNVDAISRALERFLSEPLVNQARQTLGYPELADEAESPDRGAAGASPSAAEVMGVVQQLMEPGNRELIPLVSTLLRFTPRKLQVARPVLEAIEADPRPREWAMVA
jgi:hypothetical protein